MRMVPLLFFVRVRFFQNWEAINARKRKKLLHLRSLSDIINCIIIFYSLLHEVMLCI